MLLEQIMFPPKTGNSDRNVNHGTKIGLKKMKIFGRGGQAVSDVKVIKYLLDRSKTSILRSIGTNKPVTPDS